MRHLQAKIRMIENILEHIEIPRRNLDRTILPNAKRKELKALSEKIHEAQVLVDNLDDPTARHVYQTEVDELENRRRDALFPSISICSNC